MDPLVEASWLWAHLDDPDIRVIDCRYDLASPGWGEQAYRSGHLPGAVYLDLEKDLSGPARPHGGRHPLPDPKDLAACFSKAGIGPGTAVIAYDQDMSFAPRAWWLLHFLGHDRAAVLDGGLAAWQRAGGPLTRKVAPPPAATFTPRPQPGLVATSQDVVQKPKDTWLLDARARARYRGDFEPIDARAGHIPGACSLPWKTCLQEDGTFRPKEDLKRLLAAYLDRPVIASCGSGVTACCLLLALAGAGRPDARLYAGSFSDWISFPEHAVHTGDAP